MFGEEKTKFWLLAKFGRYGLGRTLGMVCTWIMVPKVLSATCYTIVGPIRQATPTIMTFSSRPGLLKAAGRISLIMAAHLTTLHKTLQASTLNPDAPKRPDFRSRALTTHKMSGGLAEGMRVRGGLQERAHLRRTQRTARNPKIPAAGK